MPSSSRTTRYPADTTPSSSGRHVRGLRKVGWFERAEIALLGTLSWALLAFLRLTTRVELHGHCGLTDSWRKGEPTIFAFWHGRASMMTMFYKGSSGVIMNSNHRDGQIVSVALRRFGLRTIGGSSSRGAVGGMRGLFRAFSQGNDVALVPDGPRGPAGVAKPGAVELALRNRALLYPVAASATRAIRFRGWDRMMLPTPGARVIVVVGEPIVPPQVEKGAFKAARESLSAELEARLAEACQEADRMAGRDQEET